MSRNWALIVGVNQYDHHPDQNLRFAVRDAELMRDFLVNTANFPAEPSLSHLFHKSGMFGRLQSFL